MSNKFAVIASVCCIAMLCGCQATPPNTGAKQTQENTTTSNPDWQADRDVVLEEEREAIRKAPIAKAEASSKINKINLSNLIKDKYGIVGIDFKIPDSILEVVEDTFDDPTFIFQDKEKKIYYLSKKDNVVLDVYQIGQKTNFKATPVNPVGGNPTSYTFQPDKDVVVFGKGFVHFNKQGSLMNYPSFSESRFVSKLIKKG
jgi:hypothetical protein